MTTGCYRVIYADPPWYFRNFSAKGTGRAAVSHYDVLSLDELKRLSVADYAARDCALFLWALDPMLPQALELMAAWGFQFKTVAFHWVKTTKGGGQKKLSDNPFFTGLGYWTRANSEICLLGTRGKPSRLNRDVRRLIVADRREHSRKPVEIYDRIERLVEGPYLELFARERRAGWSSAGDQLDSDTKYIRRQPSRVSSSNDLCAATKRRYAAE